VYGFGWEEWNFDFQGLIDGWKYGWIEGFYENPASGNAKPWRNRVDNGCHDVLLYTYTEGIRWIVAYIRDCEKMDRNRLEWAWQAANLPRMAADAVAVGADVRGTQHTGRTYYPIGDHVNQPTPPPPFPFAFEPNVKFRPADVCYYRPLQIDLGRYYRYGPLRVSKNSPKEALWNRVLAAAQPAPHPCIGVEP
jgi:hypothetical protein